MLGFAGEEEGGEGDGADDGEVEADPAEAVAAGQPGRDVRGDGGAEQAGDVVRHRGPGVAHRGREQLRQHRPHRPERQPHQPQPDDEERQHRRQRPGAEPRPHEQSEHDDPRGDHQQRGPPPEPVGQPPGHRHGQPEEHHADQQQHQELRAGVAEPAGRGAVGQREHRHQVEQHVGREHDQRAEHKALEAAAEHVDERHLGPLAGFDDLRERRGLVQAQPHPQPDDHQRGRGQERDPPAPREERLVRHHRRQQQEQPVGDEEPDGRAQLREGAEEGALALRGVLGGQQRRTAPLAAEPEALPEPAQRQQQRREHADRRVPRQESDEDGRDAHRQQRGHQRGLAPDAVAEVPEQRGADRAGHERDRERRQRLQGRRGRVPGREEQLREHQHRGGRVDVEVVELDRGADEAGQHDLAGGVAVRRGTGGCVSDRHAADLQFTRSGQSQRSARRPRHGNRVPVSGPCLLAALL